MPSLDYYLFFFKFTENKSNMKYIYTILALALITSCDAPMQQDNGEPEGPHTSAEWQIWAYSTAAPDYIAARSTILPRKE